MHENLNGSHEAILDEYSDRAARNNLKAYLSSLGFENVGQIPRTYCQTMVDGPLEFYLDGLSAADNPESDRDRLVTYFETGGWYPKDEAEVSLALPQDLDLRSIKPAQVSRSDKARQREFSEARARYQDAIGDLETFNEIGVHLGRTGNVNPDWLRRSRRGQYMIAGFLMAREFLDNGQWPKKGSPEYDGRQAYWRGFMLFAAMFGGEVVLAKSLNHFFERAHSRYNFAAGQYSYAAHRIGRSVSESELNSPEATDYAEAADEQAAGFEMPGHIKNEQIARYAAATQRVKNQVEQGVSPRAAEGREFAGGRAIWDEAGENIIGVHLPDEPVSASAMEKSKRRPYNPAHSPHTRSRPGYDKRPDK